MKVIALMSLLKISNVLDSFMNDDNACHIIDPRKRTFSVPYSVVLGFHAEMFLPLQRVHCISFSMKV